MNRAAAVCLAGALVALAGCTAWFGPVPAPTVVPSPTATAEAVPDPGRPAMRIDLSCDDLVDGLDLASHLPGAVLQAERVGERLGHGEPTMSDAFVLAQARGLTCEWSSTGPGHSALRIELLPNAKPLWKDALEAGAVDEILFNCLSYQYDEHGSNDCYFEGLAGADWIRLRATDIDVGAWESDQDLTEATTPLFQKLVDTVKSAREVDPPATARARPLPETCEEILPVAAVNAVTVFGAQAQYFDIATFGQRVNSIAGAASWATGAPYCNLIGRADYHVYVEILPGGSWALHETLDDPSATAGPAAEVPVEGLRAGDGAWSRCSEGRVCELDLDLGGNWVQLSVSGWDENFTANEQRRLLAGLTTLATAVVERVG